MTLTDTGLVPPRDDDVVPSTAASTIAVDEEKLSKKLDITDNEATDIDGTTSDGEGSVAATTADYPEGLRMVFIVVALVLSIFLVALDMVGTPFIIHIYTVVCKPSFLILTLVYRPLWPQPSLRLQMNSMALIRYLGTALPSSCVLPHSSRHVSSSRDFTIHEYI
jgi:hypothetical protein